MQANTHEGDEESVAPDSSNRPPTNTLQQIPQRKVTTCYTKSAVDYLFKIKSKLN